MGVRFKNENVLDDLMQSAEGLSVLDLHGDYPYFSNNKFKAIISVLAQTMSAIEPILSDHLSANHCKVLMQSLPAFRNP
jgi:hypothetical protein